MHRDYGHIRHAFVVYCRCLLQQKFWCPLGVWVPQGSALPLQMEPRPRGSSSTKEVEEWDILLPSDFGQHLARSDHR